MKVSRSLVSFAAFSIMSTITCANAQPLAIKGVTIGDTVDRISAFGPCSMNQKTFCLGNTVYGGRTASFYVSHDAGRIVQMSVMYEPFRIPEVIEALKKKYGEPNGRCMKQPCASWNKDGLSLDVFGDAKIGTTFLKRSEKSY